MNIKRLMRQRNIAAISALVLLVGASVSAVAASSTYVCVNKTSKVVYFKAKCSSSESRVAISTAATNGINGQNGVNGNNGDSAYDLWLKAGNTGTTADFLKSLKGLDGMPGANGSNANLPFFQRYENALDCDAKWRLAQAGIYADTQAKMNLQQAVAQCPRPDWAQNIGANPPEFFKVVSATYGTPVYTNQQTRVNNILVDNPYAPKRISVPYSLLIEANPPAGWALCTNTDPQISFKGGTGYPKFSQSTADNNFDYSVVNNRATITGVQNYSDPEQLRYRLYGLWLFAEICGPDPKTPSGLGRTVVEADIFLPPVNP